MIKELRFNLVYYFDLSFLHCSVDRFQAQGSILDPKPQWPS
jgi:hypothetical protein